MRPPRAVPGLGLHDREQPRADEAAAVDPRPLLRRARRPQPARPQGRRRVAQVQDHRGARHARDRPARHRDSGGPVLARQPGLLAGRALQAEQARTAGAPGRQRPAGPVRVHRAEHLRDDPGATAAVRPRPVPGLHRRRLDRPVRAGLERRHLRHQLRRHVAGGPGQRRQGLRGPVALPGDRGPPPAGHPRRSPTSAGR